MSLSALLRRILTVALADQGAAKELADAVDLSTSGASPSFVNLTLTGTLTESGADSLTAVGTNQATALALTKQINRVTVGASTTGVALPLAVKGVPVAIVNSVANSIHVYGSGTDTVNDVATATGIVQPANSVVLYRCTTSAAGGKWYAAGVGGGYSGSLSTLFTAGGLTAVTGGQGGALLLSAMVNRFTTVGAGNGALLPVNAVGQNVVVTNDGANALTVYPDTGAAINGLPANTGTLLPVGATAVFYCEAANVWKTLISSPREVNTALTTAGAGVPTAAGIVGGVTTRTGPSAAFTDTTDTAVAIIAALPGAAVGQSFEWHYVNNTAFVATLAGGAGVTVSELAGGTLTVSPNSWARFLVTVATGTTVTVQGLAQGPNNALPATQFSSVNVTAGTLAAGKASGAAFTSLTSTNATPGAQAMRTVAQVLTDTPGLAVGQSYVLRVTQTGNGTLTLATDGSAQFTMTGTMTVPVNCYSDFVVTIATATTGTVQQVASGPAGQPLPASKFSSINVTTGTLAAGNASGAAFTSLMSTNATPGSQAMRTPALILTDTPGLAVGQSYTLRVTDTGAGTFTLATDSGAGFTMTGTMTVPTNTWRDFIVTITGATTGTVQAIGVGTYS